jgi:hypothetical protein
MRYLILVFALDTESYLLKILQWKQIQYVSHLPNLPINIASWTYNLTFPTWRRALKKLSSSWRVQAAHFRVGFLAIEINMDQENPALAPEKRKVWGEERTRLLFGIGFRERSVFYRINRLRRWTHLFRDLLLHDIRCANISWFLCLDSTRRKKIQYSGNRRTDRRIAQIKIPEGTNLGCRSKRPVGGFRFEREKKLQFEGNFEIGELGIWRNWGKN